MMRIIAFIWTLLVVSLNGNYADAGPGCPEYCINLNESNIAAEAGLCVVLTCSFTTATEFDADGVVWKKDERDVFDSSDPTKGQSVYPHRVSLLESDVKKKNCSIIFNDLDMSDTGSYQLRVIGILNNKRDGYTFKDSPATILVRDLTSKPEIVIPPLIVEEQATLTCTAPGLCAGSVPTITWTWRGTGTNNLYIQGNITDFKTENQGSRTQIHRSTLTINTSADHNGSTVTCKVTFAGGHTTETTETIHVRHSSLSLGVVPPGRWCNLLAVVTFLTGAFLSAFVCCVAVYFYRRRQRSPRGHAEELAKKQEILMVHAGLSGDGNGAEATLKPKEVEYASINFSALRLRGSEDREETTETEYAEIH